MRKPTRRHGRQSAKRSAGHTTTGTSTSKTFPLSSKWTWDKGVVDHHTRSKPKFPKGFKKGDFVTIAPSKDKDLEEIRKQTHVFMIVDTCWAENEATDEIEKGFTLRSYDPTGIVNRDPVDYDDIDVAFSGVVLVDVSVLAVAAQRLNDFIQRIVKDGK